MTSKEYVKNILPRARCNRYVTNSGEVYYLVTHGNFRLSEGKTESNAWVNAKNFLIESEKEELKKDENIFSKAKFNSYKIRYRVTFFTDSDQIDLDIYANNDSETALREYIDSKKSDKVISYRIDFSRTKEEDDYCEEIINLLF